MKKSTISFLFKDNGAYLSEKKKGWGSGYLNGYGGKAAEGESIEDAAVRELNEEAGVTADPKKLEKVAIIDFFEDEEHTFECHVFFVHEWEGEFKESEEMAYPGLYTLAELPYERMWESDQVWLPLVFSGEKIRARARFRKGVNEMQHFEHKPLA